MDWWRLIPKALSEDDCKKVIYRAFQYPTKDGTVGYGGKSVVDETIRKSTVRWLQREDPHLVWLYLRIEKHVLEANRDAFGLDLAAQCGGFTEVQFTEYHGDNGQKYDWHEDNSWKKTAPFDRKLSVVIQLSKPDSYSGGRLELWNDPLPDHIFHSQGDILIFPSFNRHRVTPVLSGDRYSLVTWVVGPKLR